MAGSPDGKAPSIVTQEKLFAGQPKLGPLEEELCKLGVEGYGTPPASPASSGLSSVPSSPLSPVPSPLVSPVDSDFRAAVNEIVGSNFDQAVLVAEGQGATTESETTEVVEENVMATVQKTTIVQGETTGGHCDGAQLGYRSEG
jgi:hypothetical protein